MIYNYFPLSWMRIVFLFWILFTSASTFSQTHRIIDIVCERNDLVDSLTLDELFFEAYYESMRNLDSCINMIAKSDSITSQRILIPPNIKDEFVVALNCFPDIRSKRLNFKYKKIKGTMNARPDFLNIIRSKANRKYVVLINNNKGRNKGIPLEELTPSARLGWYGHEVAHMQSYQMMSNLQMLLFSIRYITSVNYVKKAERFTDYLAIEHGLIFQIYESGKYLSTYGNITNAYKKLNVFNSLSLNEYMCLWYKSNFKSFIKEECQ